VLPGHGLQRRDSAKSVAECYLASAKRVTRKQTGPAPGRFFISLFFNSLIYKGF